MRKSGVTVSKKKWRDRIKQRGDRREREREKKSKKTERQK